MRTVGYVAAVIGAIALLLAVATVVALSVFVDPNAYRAQIERLVNEKTGRELVLGGKLELKLFPWVALAVHEVRLGNPPGFGAGPFMTIQEARIEVKLLPLLSKRLVIRGLKITGLDVNLVSRGESNNWQDLGGSKQDAAAKSNTGAAESAFISSVSLSKSMLVFHDEVKQSTTRLANIELHTGELGGRAPADVAMEFDYGEGDTSEVAHLKLGTQLVPGASSVSSIALRKLAIQAEWFGRGVAPAAGGRANSSKPLTFALRAAEIGLDTTAQTLDAPDIQVTIGDLAASISLSGRKILSDRLLSGHITVPRTSARQALQSLLVAAPPMRDPRALAVLALTSDYRITAQQAELSNLEVTLDETRLRGNAAVVDLKRMALRFDLTLDALDLDRYRAPVSNDRAIQNRPAAGVKPEPKTATPLPIETLKSLQATGALRAGRMTIAGLVLTDLSLPLTAQDGRVEVGPAKAKLYGGACEIDILLDARPALAHWSMSEHARDVDLGSLPQAGIGAVRLAGGAAANLALTGVGNTDEALIRSLSGKMDASVNQGAINGIDLDFELQRAAALLKREPEPHRAAGPARTPFNALRASGTVEQGVLRDDQVHLESAVLRAQGSGTLDLLTEVLNFRIVATVNPQAGRQAGMLGSLQSLEVPLLVRGTLAAPSVEPDLQALLEGQLRQKVNEKLQLKGDDVRKRLGGKLQDLLTH